MAKMKILLIEDSPSDIRLIEIYLKEAFSGKYNLTIANTLSEAEIEIAKERFDIIISDMTLPDSQGIETFIKVRDVTSEIPIIILTGFGDEQFGLDAVQLGAADFLEKYQLNSRILQRSIVYSIERNKLQQQLIKARVDLELRVEERTKELQAANSDLKQEIQRRKLAENSVRQLNSALNKTTNAIIISDNTGKIEWVNEGYQKMTEYSLKEAKDNTPAKLGLDPKSKYYQKVMKTKQPVTYEVKTHSKSGREYWVLTTLSPILDSEGNIEKIIAIDSDISIRKQIEKELINSNKIAESSLIRGNKALSELTKAKNNAERATQIAVEAVKAKQQFLSNMSHEIRTPMNAIIGFTNVLLKTDLDEKQRKYLDAIKVSGDTLIVLINDILDLAKVDAGKMTFEQTPFRLSTSISTMMHLFETKIQDKKLDLVKEYDPSIPEVIVGDQVRLHQIILNLLSNAIKFTSKGKIKVGVRRVREDSEKVMLEFAVSDTGIGIPEDRIDHIFEAFQQASSDTARLYGGTGLGLAIVKELVERQGGRIKVKSKYGQGTLFAFTLTFKKTKVQLAMDLESGIDPEPEIKNAKVLVVEDIKLNQLLMKTVLEEFGVEVDIAENGKVAIEMVEKNNYDIVLMDLQMPEMNGFQATKYIRNTLNSDVPIIALTADVTTVDLEKSKALGMNDYIAKPVDDKLLYNKLVKYLKVPQY